MTQPFWINEPTIIIKKEYITEIYPNQNMDFEQKLNAITRLVILLSLLGFLITRNFNIIFIGILTLLIIISIYNIKKHKIMEKIAKDSEEKMVVKKEGFENYDKLEKKDILKNKENFNNSNISLNSLLSDEFYKSSNKNPMGNVLLTEIHDNPERKSAPPSYNPEVKEKINKNVKKQTQILYSNIDNTNKQLYGDLYDNYVFDRQFMQRFYSTPNTRVTNDQGAFSQYL